MPDSFPDSAADSISAPESTGVWTEVLWEHLRAFVQTPPPEAWLEGTWKTSGEFDPLAPVPYPPASEEQLQQTEAELGFALPPELRRLYAEVANGGRSIGPVDLFYGAAGGCPRSRWSGDPQKTTGQLASHSGWRLHPRIEDALLRHPGRYVYVDSLPAGFLLLGEIESYDDTTVLDSVSGRVYQTSYPYWFQVLPTTGAEQEINISWLSLDAASLGAWFDDWLGAWTTYTGHTPAQPWRKRESGPLTADLVETSDLPDPDVVWRGLYRFGPDWWEEQSVDADLIESINQGINEGDAEDD